MQVEVSGRPTFILVKEDKSLRKPPVSAGDLEHFVQYTESLAPRFRRKRILLTGGTGFFGTWLVEGFLALNRRHELHSHLSILTRNPEDFSRRSPHLASNPALSTFRGDIRNVAFPDGHYDYVIHAATDSVVPALSSQEDQYTVIVEGTRRVLEFASRAGVERMLYVSSGAVYGPQSLSVLHVREDDPFQPDDSVYMQGKREAERLCLEHQDRKLACVLARGFAFLGPHLPLRAHFAAGNFLADALYGMDIEIRGDGTPLRSYLYTADLAIWLWTLLLRGGASQAYNVGAEESVSIRELAERTVAIVNPRLHVHVRGEAPPSGLPPPRYVPCTQKAREELGLKARIGLEEALRRTAAWHRSAAGQASQENNLRE